MELERDDAALEPAKLHSSSKSPSSPLRTESPGAPPKEDAQESGEERPEIEITPPGATGRQSDSGAPPQFLPPSRFWRDQQINDASVPINMSENLYSHVLHIIVQTSSSLNVFACLRDLRRQCSQSLLSVSFKDIIIPPLLWRNVG